ncbi:MAG: methionine--tRNA ligase [bacterium]
MISPFGRNDNINMNKETFYITTPIYYVNDKPHVGHAYTTIAADVRARFERMRGKEVLFLTGTDENSQKNIEAAEKMGEPDIQKYLDTMSALWQRTWDSLGISNDDFIRTIEPRHHKTVEIFYKKVFENGDIYKGRYEGLYCVGCEAFKKESDLAEGLCPDHKKAPQKIVEENYFFKLSKYRDALLEYIGKHPEFIKPASRRNEILSYIREFMEDVSISRQSMKWGIPVPGDPEHKIYVWFDALVNYLSAVGYGVDEKKFEKFWPAIHLVGKDIIKFHVALWPAMLMSAGLPLPKQVFANGFFTIDGQKMSKSLGNSIDPVEVATKFGNDALRYALLREINYGADGDFSLERLATRYRTELAGELGNLVNRVLAMAEKYCASKVPAFSTGATIKYLQYDQGLENFEFQLSIDAVWDAVREANRFVDESAPWKLAKLGEEKRLAAVMYQLLETLRHIGRMLLPLLPESGEKILTELGDLEAERSRSWDEGKTWGLLKEGAKLSKLAQLFPALDDK